MLVCSNVVLARRLSSCSFCCHVYLEELKQLWYYLHSKFFVLTVANSKQLTSSEPAALLDLLLPCFIGPLIVSSRAFSFGYRTRVEGCSVMIIFVVWQLALLTVMFLQVLEDMSGFVLGNHACRENVALVCGLELLGAIVTHFSVG